MSDQAVLDKAASLETLASKDHGEDISLFWKLYAKCHDSLYSLMPYRKLLWDCLQAIDLKPGMKILDANCGTGNFELFLNEKGLKSVEVEAVSHASSNISRAFERCRDLGFVSFSQADAAVALNYYDNTFDRIICKNAFFSFKKIDFILAELYRVLKPNGKLILVNPKSGSLCINTIINDHFRRINNITGTKRKIASMFQSRILLPRTRFLTNTIIEKAQTELGERFITSKIAQNILKRNKFKDVDIFLSNAGQHWVISGYKKKQRVVKIDRPVINLNRLNQKVKPRINIRQATDDDIYNIRRIELAVWGEGAASTNQIRSRIAIFPKGNLVAEVGNKIVGHASFMLIDYDRPADNDSNTWYKLTDNGFMSTHEDDGKDLFAINLSVIKDSPANTSRLLIIGVAKTGVEFRVRRYILGSRIPSYYKYCNRMTVKQYVNSRSSSNRCLDPELEFYRQQGLKIIEIVPNYFIDPQSKDFGVIVKQDNPFKKMPLKLLSRTITQLPLNTVRLIDRLN